MAPPVFSGSRGFFALDENRFVARNLEDGSQVWSIPRTPLSQPAAGGGLVYLVEPQRMIAVAEEDGSIAWEHPFRDTLAVPLVWDNEWLVAATTSRSILAFRASDGELIWRRELDANANARPALASDRVYVPATNERVIALQVEDGSVLWERRLGGVPNDVLAVDDRVYVGSADNYLYCLKADEGLIDWRWPTGADVVGLPVADDETIYFTSLDNVLRALHRTRGNQRWKRALPIRPKSGPGMLGDVLVVSGITPMLRAYFLRDGAPAGEVATDGELAAAPYILSDAKVPTVIVVTRNIAKGDKLTSIIRASEPAPAPVADPKTAPGQKP